MTGPAARRREGDGRPGLKPHGGFALGALVALAASVLIPSPARAQLQNCTGLWSSNNPPAITATGNLTAVYAAANEHQKCVFEQDNQQAVTAYFALSYNKQLKNPNWVAFVLNPARALQIATLHANQTNLAYLKCCQPDIAISPLDQATHLNFAKQGNHPALDEGHMAPRNSMEQSLVALADANRYTNISPQYHALNGGAWEALEKQVRAWAGKETVYVIAGPLFNNAAQPTYTAQSPAQLQVALPEHFFMVLYFPGRQQGTRREYYLFPNQMQPLGPYTQYKVTETAFNGALPQNYAINFNLGPP